MKKLLFGNLSTKAMALFLAALTWMYLFTQGTDEHDLDVLFLPRFDARDFAAANFTTPENVPLIPAQAFKVHVSGPKGDVRALRPRTFKCEPLIDPQALTSPYGDYKFSLDRNDFDLPDKYAVVTSSLKLRYVKFETRRIKIVAAPDLYEGEPAPDHKVDSITAVPGEIDVRLPADRQRVKEIPIKPVRLDHNRSEFTVAGELEDPDIRPMTEFKVTVRIIPVPKIARMTLDLYLNAKPENQKRIEMEVKTITIEIQGPEELIKEAEKRPAVFQPYVVVNDTDMEPIGPKTISQLGCHILDPKYQGKIAVIFMPDEKPENRQIKIKILQK